MSGARGWIAVALAVWLGGLSCLLGCAAEVAAAGHAHGQPSPAATDEGSCTDGCCQKDGGDSQPTDSGGHPAKEMDCCLAIAAPGVLAKTQAADFALVAADSLAAAKTTFSPRTVLADDSFLADSGGTYLKNRALRI